MVKFVNAELDGSLVGVEIGVGRGANAKNILENLNIDMLYLIDPYKPYVDDDGKTKNYSDFLPQVRADLSIANVVFILKESGEAVDEVPDNVDFVYIDGNHSYEYVKKDIELYYPKVRRGGVIGGHDFIRPVRYSVCPHCMSNLSAIHTAVLEFVREHSLKLHTGNSDWWIKKS